MPLSPIRGPTARPSRICSPPALPTLVGPVVGPDAELQGPGGLPAELPVTTGQYFPFHNHDDYKATNNGVYPGGMFTMIMTTP